MNRRQALEDLFLAVRNDLLNKGVSKKKTAFKVAEAVWAKAADNKKLTIEDIKQLRDTFLK